MSDHTHREIQDLRISVLMLTDRVDQLERAASIEPAPAPGPAPAAPAVATARVVPPPRPSRPAPPPRQPRPPRDWGKLAEQLFAARTLAWAGGVATTLGVVLLFVMATSRGWITPSMRVGIGMAVSLLVLVAAVEFDRRKWRADAILAAGGVGIAGLYTTLWAATSVYHLISAPAAAPLSALIAAIAVGLAIRIRQEPLAVFGMSAAMVAPVVVSHDVTAGGVLFAAVMIAAALPLFLRLRWRTLVAALWAIGFAETLVLLAVSHAHHGFTSAVIATAVVAALFIAVTFALELTRSTRTSVSWLASIIAGSAFTLSLGAAFLYAGERQVNGHSLAGLALIVVALAWAVLAAVPTLARRPHANLTDGLVAFALAALAIATGLLAGGPALVCAWAAESAMLIALAERAARRDVRRRPRLVISAGIYLVLATAATWLIVAPSDGHLTAIGAGSASGVIALVAIAIAGVVFSFGTRWLSFGEQQITWALPAIALGFLPVWALPAEWAVVAYAGMAAAMLVYRRSPAMIGWMRDEVTIAVAGGWWLSGALVAVAVTAPIRELGQGWKMLGAGDGVTGLVALLAAAAVFVWSVRRPQRRFWEFALLAPVVTFAYLVAEVLAAPYAMWAWLVAATVVAAAVQVPAVRQRLGLEPLIAASGGLLTLGVISAWASDRSLMAITHHGLSTGWQSIALAVGASLMLALALPEPRRRTDALWVPMLLAAQLAAMTLPGQYPLVMVAGLSAIASVIAITWRSPFAGRFDRTAMAGIGIVSSIAISAITLFGYETPRLVFHTSHDPAAGLAAAIAATCSLFLATSRRPPDSVDSRGRATLGRRHVPGRRGRIVDGLGGDPRRRAAVRQPGLVALDSRPLSAGTRAGIDHLGTGRTRAGGRVASR